MSLKNPFGERKKDGKLILISDISQEENGKACGCVCPFCKGDFQAKRNGKVRQPHFAHLGKPCNETIAFMTSLYGFFKQSVELNGTFCAPSVYANFSGLAADQWACLETIRGYTSFSTTCLDEAEAVLKSYSFEVEKCEIIYKKELPEALVLTAKEKQKKLAVIIVPPETVCKEQQSPKPYNNLPTLAVYIDKNVNFYKLHSEQLLEKVEQLDFLTEWIRNDKLKKLEEDWLKRKLEEHQAEYEKIQEQRKDTSENPEVLEQKKRASELLTESYNKNVIALETIADEQFPSVPDGKIIRSQGGTRWCICTICHKLKPEFEMVCYQYSYGICRACSRKS